MKIIDVLISRFFALLIVFVFTSAICEAKPRLLHKVHMYEVNKPINVPIENHYNDITKTIKANPGDTIIYSQHINGHRRLLWNIGNKNMFRKNDNYYISDDYFIEKAIKNNQITVLEVPFGFRKELFSQWKPEYWKAVYWLFWTIVGILACMLVRLILWCFNDNSILTRFFRNGGTLIIIYGSLLVYFLNNHTCSWWFALDAEGWGWIGFLIAICLVFLAGGLVLGLISEISNLTGRHLLMIIGVLLSAAFVVISLLDLYEQGKWLIFTYLILLSIGLSHGSSNTNKRKIELGELTDQYGFTIKGEFVDSRTFLSDHDGTFHKEDGGYYTQIGSDRIYVVTKKYYTNESK